jgi:hypothetical protein
MEVRALVKAKKWRPHDCSNDHQNEAINNSPVADVSNRKVTLMSARPAKPASQMELFVELARQKRFHSLMEASMRLIPILAAATIGLWATGASAQHYLQGEPGEAPGVPQDGYGKPQPVSRAEVIRDNTAGPGEAPGVSQDGYGKPQPVDPAELRRDDTANPGSLPTARR